jgi:hypothetical protein
MEKDFYVTLQSNASMNIYPDNKTSIFRTVLPNSLKLINYKAALCEISFPNKFKNVLKHHNSFSYGYHVKATYHDEEEKKTKEKVFSYIEKCHILPGYFYCINDLLLAINDSLKADQNKTIPAIRDCSLLEMNEGKVTITKIFKSRLQAFANEKGEKIKSDKYAIVECKCDIQFANRLAHMIGYNANVNLYENSKPSFNYNLNAGIPREMLIYSNIINHQIVSDTHAPLLRSIPVSLINEFTHIEFKHRNYMCLSSSDISEILIECRDAQANLSPFLDGCTVQIVLHFSSHE